MILSRHHVVLKGMPTVPGQADVGVSLALDSAPGVGVATEEPSSL